MSYEISPSTLKMITDKRFGCQRCFWLKVIKGVRPPEPVGLGKLHHEIHNWQYEYFRSHPTPILLPGPLVSTELTVKATELNGIILWGILDGLIELSSGGYAIVDMKTTSSPNYAIANYSLQLNAYAYCLTHAQPGYPSYDIQRLGVLTFTGHRFGINHAESAGIVGKLMWHEVTPSEISLIMALRQAETILGGPCPNPRIECEWCQFYESIRGEKWNQ